MTMYGAACRRLSGSVGTRLVKPTLRRDFGMTMYGAAFGRVLGLGAGTVGTRHSSELVKPNAKRIFHVDTLALVGKLKSCGVDPKVAHAMTVTMMEVLNEFTDNVSDSFITNSEMQRSEMLMENNVSNFKIEFKSLQDQRRLLVQHKLDKMSTNVERMVADTGMRHTT